MPPYTTRSAGRSATSGSRLFIRQRRAASCCHPLQRSWLPRGARISGAAVIVIIPSRLLLPREYYRQTRAFRGLEASCQILKFKIASAERIRIAGFLTFRQKGGTGMTQRFHKGAVAIVIAFVLALMTLSAVAQDVRTNSMPGVDFSKYHTYKWVKIPNAKYPNQI